MLDADQEITCNEKHVFYTQADVYCGKEHNRLSKLCFSQVISHVQVWFCHCNGINSHKLESAFPKKICYSSWDEY